MWKVVEASAGNLALSVKSSIHTDAREGQPSSSLKTLLKSLSQPPTGDSTDLKAGSGAPWAGHWRQTGVVSRESMAWATNPESFGMDPPTGSEERNVPL